MVVVGVPLLDRARDVGVRAFPVVRDRAVGERLGHRDRDPSRRAASPAGADPAATSRTVPDQVTSSSTVGESASSTTIFHVAPVLRDVGADRSGGEQAAEHERAHVLTERDRGGLGVALVRQLDVVRAGDPRRATHHREREERDDEERELAEDVTHQRRLVEAFGRVFFLAPAAGGSPRG